MLGITDKSRYDLALNFLLINAKQYIYKSRFQQSNVIFNNFKTWLKKEYNIERFIAYKNCNWNTFNKKWSKYYSLFRDQISHLSSYDAISLFMWVEVSGPKKKMYIRLFSVHTLLLDLPFPFFFFIYVAFYVFTKTALLRKHLIERALFALALLSQLDTIFRSYCVSLLGGLCKVKSLPELDTKISGHRNNSCS